MKILTIISHTEHYKLSDGTIVGWGPTVTEINHLAKIFDEIYHIAMLHTNEAPNSSLPYTSSSIQFIPLKPTGGKGVFEKLKIVLSAPSVIKTVHKTLAKSDYFQLRGPTGIGIFLIPYLTLFSKKKGWFKYAGNWNQENPPLGYRLQRWLLKQQSRVVTINGSWDGQPRHCLTFENPCLTDMELIEGASLGKQKSIEGKLTCCFVGRLEKPKGVERIIEAIGGLSIEEKNRIHAVHLVGDGLAMNYFKSIAEKSGVNFVFHGALSREHVFEIYKASQIFLMPTTASEGFPKVIAEAMNFGCLPIVSNISSIGQYIKHMKTGLCLEAVTSNNLKFAIQDLWEMNDNQFLNILINQRSIVKNFSFNYYNHRIKTEIISLKK
jgi:glycosyltransferase involved in cell wall biosynthesis